VRPRPDRERFVSVQTGIEVQGGRAVSEIVRRDRAAEDRQEDQEDDEDAAADRDLVVAEAAPDLLPVPARANDIDLSELAPGLDGDRRREPRLRARADEIAFLPRLKPRQPCSQSPGALPSISPSSTPASSAIAPAMPAPEPRRTPIEIEPIVARIATSNETRAP